MKKGSPTLKDPKVTIRSKGSLQPEGALKPNPSQPTVPAPTVDNPRTSLPPVQHSPVLIMPLSLGASSIPATPFTPTLDVKTAGVSRFAQANIFDSVVGAWVLSVTTWSL